MENSVYLCGWRRSAKGICLWTLAEPHARVEEPTFGLAEERLLEAIRIAGGALHAVLELDPPLPKSEQEMQFSVPELYLIGGDVRFETDAPRSVAFETAEEKEARSAWVDTFFDQPICRKCGASSSPRTERPLRLINAPRRYDGAFGHVGHDSGTYAQIVSEEFLDLLLSEERRRLVIREVDRMRKGRKFYELIGPEGPSFVAVAGLPASGWRCSGCGRTSWGYWIKGFSIHTFVAAADLPRPLPSIFTVGGSQGVHLCATGARWRELAGKKGVRGFVSSPLGVVSDHKLVRCPVLPTCEERLAENQRPVR